MLGTRNRVHVGEETPAYVAPVAGLAMLAIGASFAYVLARSSDTAVPVTPNRKRK